MTTAAQQHWHGTNKMEEHNKPNANNLHVHDTSVYLGELAKSPSSGDLTKNLSSRWEHIVSVHAHSAYISVMTKLDEM